MMRTRVVLGRGTRRPELRAASCMSGLCLRRIDLRSWMERKSSGMRIGKSEEVGRGQFSPAMWGLSVEKNEYGDDATRIQTRIETLTETKGRRENIEELLLYHSGVYRPAIGHLRQKASSLERCINDRKHEIIAIWIIAWQPPRLVVSVLFYS
jgi:hypothetical protein